VTNGSDMRLEVIEQSEERTFVTMGWKLQQPFGFQVWQYLFDTV